MPNYRELENTLTNLAACRRRPVAVAFRNSAPEGVAKFDGVEPSGCSFWRIASQGKTFYTDGSDHNCPVGSYTHNLPLENGRAKELEETLDLMTGIGYLRMEEVPGVMRLPRTPKAIVYAPLGDAPVDPDVVLVAARPGRAMLFVEAAIRAGAYSNLPLLARPTCMAIPAAMERGVVASAGCIGNRVYTEIGEDELYVAIPGSSLEKIAAESVTIETANARLAEYHVGRAASMSTGRH